jgi:hypothetical protein
MHVVVATKMGFAASASTCAVNKQLQGNVGGERISAFQTSWKYPESPVGILHPGKMISASGKMISP